MKKHPLIIWLSLTGFMVFFMAIIGAVTRLTDSGLSMVEWRPLLGALPPLHETEWIRVFDLYKNSPEYTKQNDWMALSDFKNIFFWEWLHRAWGRLIGLVYAVPLVFFWLKGKIPKAFQGRFLFILLLGGAQAVMGWIMVQSGLIDRPSVSHYRLAAHLFLAVLLFSLLVWTILDLKTQKVRWSWDHFCLKRHGLISLALLYITIIWGAFVAGLDGGMIYNTWPLMGDHWIPQEALHFYNNPAGAQFAHRWIAMVTGLSILLYAIRVRSVGLSVFVFIQIGLGLATLLSQVSLPLAVLHQACAFALLCVLLVKIHKTFSHDHSSASVV